MDLSAYKQPKEWWWVVECSDYLRKLHPGTPRFAVIPIGNLNQYNNIECRVRFSTEKAANAAAIAAENGAGDLTSWYVVWWPVSYRTEHSEGARFGVAPMTDIRNVWNLGGKSVASGMSRPDAEREAARRSALPELWCVITNDDNQTKRQQPYTVKSFDGLSFIEVDDKVRATCESETVAWQTIPKIVEEDRQREAKYKQEERDFRIAEEREARRSRVFHVVKLVVLLLGAVWLLVTVIHYFWVHPLF